MRQLGTIDNQGQPARRGEPRASRAPTGPPKQRCAASRSPDAGASDRRRTAAGRRRGSLKLRCPTHPIRGRRAVRSRHRMACQILDQGGLQLIWQSLGRPRAASLMVSSARTTAASATSPSKSEVSPPRPSATMPTTSSRAAAVQRTQRAGLRRQRRPGARGSGLQAACAPQPQWAHAGALSTGRAEMEGP